MPITSMMSLIPTGTPCSGPTNRLAPASASRSRARASAPASSTWTHARSSASSALMRPRHASRRATGESRPSRMAWAASRAARFVSSVEGIEHLGDDFESAERRHEIDAGVASANGLRELLGHLDADPKRRFASGPEARPHAVGDRDPRNLVMEKFGMAEAVQRQHADQQRYR